MPNGVNYQSIQRDFEKREKAARRANVRREREIRGIYGDIISQGQGAARTAGLAEIERTKTQAIGAGTQQMISSGMFGTTTTASIPTQAIQRAGLQRLTLEDMLQQRTNQAKLGLAGFAERIETPYPDYGMLMYAMSAQAATSGTSTAGRGAGAGAGRVGGGGGGPVQLWRKNPVYGRRAVISGG